MTVPNPYVVNIELFWPDGTRPNQNQIAVVRAFDSNAGTNTWEGESGWNPANGHWQSIVMQNRAVFLSRGMPHLYFEVVNTQNVVVYKSAPPFDVPADGTIRIVIGVSATLDGGPGPGPGPDDWRVSGTVTQANGTPLTVGKVHVFDWTNGSLLKLGEATLSSSGGYSFVFQTSQFASNGGDHPSPNLYVRVTDLAENLLGFAGPVPGTRDTLLNVLLLPPNTQQYRVYGAVTNALGLPVAGLRVQATHLAWTSGGFVEVPLGEATSGGAGDYEILYLPPTVEGATACNSPPGEVNLLVYLYDANNGPLLYQAPPISPALPEQRVDLTADRAASVTQSEYSELEARLAACFGADETLRWKMLNDLGDRPDYLSIAARTSGVNYDLLFAYIKAWQITAQINRDMATPLDPNNPNGPTQWPSGLGPLDPQVIYALLRRGLGGSLAELLDVAPERFFQAIVWAVDASIVDRALETSLASTLQPEWQAVLAFYLGVGVDPQTGDPSWQSQLLTLVISDEAKRREIAAAYYAHQGTFSAFLDALVAAGTISAPQQEDLLFVFQLYSAVDQYFETVKWVYWDKGPRQWTSIADLATVPLHGQSGESGWYEYAWNQSDQHTSVRVFPGDIPGRTPEEKAEVYAQRLYDKFGGKAPQSRFTADAAAAGDDPNAPPGWSDATDFLEDQPDFDLGTTQIDKYLSDNAVTLSPQATDVLKQLQRVYRLVPDYEVAAELIAAGLDSAVKVAEYDEDQFVADFEDVLGLTAARSIHRKAKLYASEVYTTLVRFHQVLNEVGGMVVVPSAADFTAAAASVTGSAGASGAAQRFPNWVTLFGSLNSSASRHCQTVLGPGAYLVDLLSFVSGAPRNELFARRPDLVEIELTCPNTERAVPYIDLVNEILGALVAPTDVPMADAAGALTAADLVNAAGGNAAATNRVLSVLRAAGYLFTERASVKTSALDTPQAREWIVEDDAWRFTIRAQSPSANALLYPAHGSPQTSETARLLDVFPEHSNPAAQAVLETTLYPFQLPLALGRAEVDLILERRGTTRHEVRAAFQVALDTAALFADPAIALAYLKLTPAEASAITPPASIGTEQLWGLPSSGADVPRPEDPSARARGTFDQVLAELSVFLQRAQLRYAEVLDLLDTEFVHDPNAPRITLLGGPTQAEADANILEGNYNRFVLANLTPVALRRISFFLRLRRKLGWSIPALDRVLMNAFGGQQPSDLVEFSQFVRLCSDLGRSPAELMSFWQDLDTRRTERKPRSPFDDVFLKGDPAAAEYRAFDRLARENVAIDFQTTPPAGSSALGTDALKITLRGALQLSAQDLDALWLELVTNATPDPVNQPVTQLDLPTLSNMRRIALFCQSVHIAVADFFTARSLLGIDPFPTGASLAQGLVASYTAALEIQRLKTLKGGVSEVGYLLRDESPLGADLAPTAEQLEAAYQQMAALGGEVVTRYPESAQPDAAFARSMLEQVIPQERAGRAASLLETPGTPVNSADVTFLARYFVAFWPTVTAAAVQALLALPTALERYDALWAQLRPFLVGRARREAALQVASASTGAPRDVVDRLLTGPLTRVAPPSTAPAMGDWVLGLSGFDTGHETLVRALAAVYQSHWIVPADGSYRLVVDEYVAAASTAAPNVTLGGAALSVVSSQGFDPGTPNERTRTTYAAVTQKAGDVVSLRVQYAGSGAITLLLQPGDGDPVLLPASSLSALDARAYRKLDKAVRLVRSLGLTASELGRLLSEDPALLDELPLTDPAAPPAPALAWSRLSPFIDRLQLNRRVALDRTTLFDLLAEPVPASGPDPVEDVARIANLSGYKSDDIQAVLGLWPGGLLRDIDTWFVLERCLQLTRKIDLRAAQIIDLLVTSHPGQAQEPSVASAAALRNSLRSRYSEDGWRDTFKPVRDKLRQAERDAWVGYLTTRPIPINGTDHDFIDENDLFAFLLIDVETEPDTQISRIKLALNSVQLFVQRVFLGLEPPKTLRDLEKKKQQWTWMANYRVWEANRKVFLYPENWLEPELRDDKTELFQQLEQELLQDEITADRGKLALSSYLEGLDEISDLVIVGACVEGKFYAGTSSVLHMVGRTRSAPFTYYHRRFEGRQFNDGVFAPWRKVPLEIDAQSVAPVVVDGALRLLWPLVTLKEKVAPNGNDGSALGSNAEIRLMWSTLMPNVGKWTKPRLGKAKVFDDAPVTVFDRDKGADGPDTSFYHFATGVESNGRSLTRVEVYKTQFPTDSDSYIHPKKLGSINITAAGEDYAELASSDRSMGNNYPVGTYLLYNAAIEYPDEVVEGASSGMSFAFRGSSPYFNYHTPPFRSVVTNFGYLGGDNQPFFFETPETHLFALHRETTRTEGASPALNQRAVFTTLNHPQLSELKNRYNANGPEGIMNRLAQALPVSEGRYYYSLSNYQVSATQGGYLSGYHNRYNGYYGGIYLGYHIAGDRMAWGVAQRDFEGFFVPGSETVETPYPMPTVEFGYGTAFGIYNWELFFHLPLLIADRLTQQLRFSEALDWYHYVFDPRSDLNNYEKSRRFPYKLPPGARYWNFLPFFANKDATDTLLDVFGVTENLSSYERTNLAKVIDEWRRNPFNPHLVARQRIVAYQKSVVMKYLENLIAWGDQLFRQDTFESINQATQLYVLAAEILGKRPEVIEPLVKEPRYTYRELFAHGITPFSNALVEVENLLVATSSHVDGKNVDAAPPEADSSQRTAIATLYFRVPRNEKLDGYWDTVADRLFKIRNSMNIDGIKRQLALFEPPIDPALLIKAAAAGVDLSSAISQLSQPLPYYRFSVWSAKAQDLANELKSFGGSLLSALEKKDAEAIALLRQTQELRLLGLVKKVRTEQVKEAEANITALEASQAMAQDRLDDYSKRKFISPTEAGAMIANQSAASLELQAGVHNTIAGALGVIPQIAAGAFSATAEFGGLHLSQVFQAIATGFSTAAGVARNVAGQMSTLGSYERRKEDWDLSIRQARLELTQIEKQKIAAQIRLQIAQKELENHETQIAQSEEVRDFLQGKFTNQELYQWMIGELSRTYRKVYNLAFDVAKTAERAFQFELGISATDFIQFGYFDSLRQGLLAGEKLSYDVKRMDVGYLQKDKREFEITKSISLAQLNPLALEDLRETGECNFSLPEVLFDLDFPGQYFRRIRAVRVTIPCVTGPYTSVSAKLSLLGSAVRVQAAADSNYAYQGVDDPRFVHDVGGIQSIATSTAQDDAGLFELNFRDERYRPFEGCGAISRWRLELPGNGLDPTLRVARQFDYSTISDVVLTLSYTARDAGGSLKQGAIGALTSELNRVLDVLATSDTGLGRVFSLKREFPDALQQLLTSGSTTLSILPEHFPYLLRDRGYTLTPLDQLRLVVLPRGGAQGTANGSLGFARGAAASGPYAISGTGIASTNIDLGSTALFSSGNETWTLAQSNPANLTLSPSNVDDIVFELGYTLS